MAWPGRSRSARPKATATHAVEDPASGAAIERASPGLAALFGALRADGGHTMLDLGPASSGHLHLFTPYARRIRFAGLLPRPPQRDGWAAALRRLPPAADRPYDVVLVWDLLDRLDPAERPPVVARLAELSAPGARLYAIVDTSGVATTWPLRFTLRTGDRVLQEAVGPPEPAYPQLLPAQVERTLRPFEVQHAFTLRGGFREYVATKAIEDPAGARLRLP